MPSPSRRHLLVSLLAAGLGAPRIALAAPAVPLLRVWSDGLDPAGYLVSEKYDGVRGMWDGTTLRSRSGRVLAAPAAFTAGWPRTALDGELWLGRGRFDELSGTVRRERPGADDWRALRYLVFELPGAPGGFAERAAAIEAIVRRSGSAHLVAVAQSVVADRAALQQRLADVVAQGGEGLALHRADAPYETGRSDAILKLKPTLDAEAVVVGHRAGAGKYAGQLGALDMRTPDGRRFLLGSGLTDALRREPPPIGSVVTYRYRDLTGNGLPRFASFLRVHTAL
ncbi:MAG: DNA ligase [Pseudomonadota bacterium]